MTHSFRSRARCSVLRTPHLHLASFVALLLTAAPMTPIITPIITPLSAQAAPVVPAVETSIPFDSAGRIMAITPTLVSRLGLTAPDWPVSGAFVEARLYRSDAGGSVLVVRRTDGTIARYPMTESTVTSLRRAVETGIVAVGRSSERVVGPGTGIEVSQPAGNTFVRNQTFLGLAAYGPATAALLSDAGGAAAGGGYLLAAGASFFVAANIVKNRTVTRAQALRAAHGGTRGAIMGLGAAAIGNADGGSAWGAPVLAGAIGGTVAGYLQARGLSDGEAASAGLFADLGMATTLGIAAAGGAFTGRKTEHYYNPDQPEWGTYTRTDNSLRGPGKAAVGAAMGAGVIGYMLGPRYARRAEYNVTAGDAGVVFTSAALGGLAFAAIPHHKSGDAAVYGTATAGVLAGALFADRALVRIADRSSADGALIQLGAVAGALIGGGVAAVADFERRGAFALGSAGGILGLLAADRIVRPARDAGPLRGISPSTSSSGAERFSLTIGPVTSVRITF